MGALPDFGGRLIRILPGHHRRGTISTDGLGPASAAGIAVLRDVPGPGVFSTVLIRGPAPFRTPKTSVTGHHGNHPKLEEFVATG